MKKVIVIIIVGMLLSCTTQRKKIKKKKEDPLSKIKSEKLVSLASDSINRKKYKEAKKYIKVLENRDNVDFSTEMLKGRYNYTQGKYKKSKSIFRNLYKNYPKNKNVNFYLGLTYYKQNIDNMALKFLYSAYRLGYRSKYLKNTLTKLFMREAKYSQAISFFRNVLDKNRKNAYIRYNLAMAYYYSRSSQDAIDQLKLLKHYSPKYELAYYGLGFIYYNLYRQNNSYKYDAKRYLKKYLSMEDSRGYLKKKARRFLNNIK